MRQLSNPYAFATDGNYPAGAFDWSGDPRIVVPSTAALAAGFTPDTPVAAETQNYLQNRQGDALTVQAHAALRTWKRTLSDTNVTAWAQVIGMLPTRSFDANGERQRMPTLLGTNPAGRLGVSVSNDGSALEASRLPNPGVIFAPTCACAGRHNEALTGDGGSTNIQYSTNCGFAWTTSATSFATAAVHYNATADAYLRLDIHGQLFISTTLPTFSGVTLAATAADATVSEFADDGGLNIVLVSKVSGHAYPSIFHSGDGGASWTLVTTSPASFFANVAYSAALGAFYLWTDDGTLSISTTGSSWSTVATGLTTSKGFDSGNKTLACAGAALVKTWFYQPSGSFKQRGIAYSFDSGATWNACAFGDAAAGGADFQQIRAISGRLYVVDSIGLWSSGLFGSPAVEF